MGKVVDKQGNAIEGLADRYDNITDNGEVLFLDEERLVRKEQPDKPLYRNHKRGLGIKDFLVTHLSARSWNWGLVLALFRKIVKWSAFMKKPGSFKSNLYKKAMMFDPKDEKYSTGTIYNLNVDGDTVRPGVAAYNGYPATKNPQRAIAELERTGEISAEQAGFLEKKAPEVRKRSTSFHKAEDVQLFDHEALACKGGATSEAGVPKNPKTIELNQLVSDDIERDMTSVELPIDLVMKAIDEAECIGGMKECLCRAGNDCKDYPKDLACLFLNMGGKVVVDHKMAVELTKEEAKERVARAAALGLSCQSLWVEVEQLIWGFRNDQMDAFLEICFCCPCCCVAFNLSKNATPDVKRRFSPTGWTAVVDRETCTGCQQCLSTYCPQDAIHFRESDGTMVVDQEICVGCGICRRNCPEGVIAIKQTMPMRESMHDYFLKEGRLEIVSGM